MKLKQSLATQKWVATEASALSVRAPDFRFEILRENNGEQLKATGDQYTIIATAIDAETAVAIAALPQLYAACLEALGTIRHLAECHGGCINAEVTAVSAIESITAALDAANAADEPE